MRIIPQVNSIVFHVVSFSIVNDSVWDGTNKTLLSSKNEQLNVSKNNSYQTVDSVKLQKWPLATIGGICYKIMSNAVPVRVP